MDTNANLKLCACGCGRVANRLPLSSAVSEWLGTSDVNYDCLSAALRSIKPLRVIREEYVQKILSYRAAQSTLAILADPEASAHQGNAPTSLFCKHCSAYCVATPALGECSYCHLRIHGNEINQRHETDRRRQNILARDRMVRADRKLVPTVTATTRELRKGHPRAWPSQEGEDSPDPLFR